ncbi:MAG: lipopolysaccharide biosynthesis protein [Solirubrobacteraceae bacterium]
MSTPATDIPRGRLAALRGRLEPPMQNLRGSDTAKAAGLAGAMIANNVVALGSTFVFARELDDYGSLGALVSYVLILAVVGQAMQVATAREGVLGHLGSGADLLATVRSWTRALAVFTLVLTGISIALQDPIAAAVGVRKYSWAAAAGIPAGCVWLELSLLRGVLQGVGDLKSVGISLVAEQTVRLFTGAILAAAWLGVTGAYLGSLLSFVAMSVYCWWTLRRHVAESGGAPAPRTGAAVALGLWSHVRRAWAPIAGLSVIAVLQNIDLIAAKHQFSKDTASSYAATAVAAKVLIWVAIGAGFYLVPEVSRRRAAGEDTRPVLGRALGIIAVCAVPVLLIFAGVPHLLLSVAFGKAKATASGSLLVLGSAFTVLAATYLAIQYMLALKRTWFLLPLGLIAVAEPLVLVNGPKQPSGFAAAVLAIQAVGAVIAFGIALGGRGAPYHGLPAAVPVGDPPTAAALDIPPTARPPLAASGNTPRE